MMKKKYNFAFFDEGSKREIRRASLKAICIPGYQVPFASWSCRSPEAENRRASAESFAGRSKGYC